MFTELKDLNPLKNYNENQEASYNLKLGFALSNRPHFNSAYSLRMPFSTDIAVFPNTSSPDSRKYFNAMNVCDFSKFQFHGLLGQSKC